MHLFLTITSILLQVVTSQLNSTILPSAKEQVNNTDGGKAGPIKERIMPLATEFLLNVPQSFPQVQQDQMTDHQRVILDDGLKLLPRISPAAANTSPSLRKKRHQQNEIDLGKNSQNESEEEKHNTSIVEGKKQLSKEKAHDLISQKNGAIEKLEDNEKVNSKGDDSEDEEEDEDDDKNENEEEDDDDDDADDTYEEDKINESGDTANDDEDESYKLKGKLKEYKSGEIENSSGKSRDYQSYHESKDKPLRSSDSICPVKSPKEQKKQQKGETEKKPCKEAILTGNKAPKKSSDKQLKNTDNDDYNGAVNMKEKDLNNEATSQSKNLTLSQDSKINCGTGDTKQKQNDTKQKEIKQKKQKSKDENKKTSAGGDESYFCRSKNNTTSHVDSEKQKNKKDILDNYPEKETAMSSESIKEKRLDNQSAANHGKSNKKMKSKDKKTKCPVEDKESEATSTSKSNCPVPIRHEDAMASNKSMKSDDEKYGASTEVQTEKLHSGTSASLKHEKNTKGKSKNCLEHEFKEEINANSEKPKMKNEINSVLAPLKNAAKKVECPVKVLKNDKSTQEENVKALQERIFLPSNQEKLGKKKINIPVLPTKSSYKNESLSTLFPEVNECKTATAKIMTKSSTAVSNKIGGGTECAKLPHSNLGDTNDSAFQDDRGNVTQLEPLSSIENKTRSFDVLRSKLEKLGTGAGKKSLGKNKDTLGSNNSSPATVTTSDPCIKNEEETSETGDELPARQSVKYLSRVDKTKLQELLKDSGNNDKNKDWWKHNVDKNSFKKPFQMYINMLNSLTKKSLKTETKKSKDLWTQEKSSDQERPKIASYDEMNSSPPIKYNNALEDTARDLLQVYISEKNKPTMIPSDTENSRSDGQTSLPEGRVSVDLMPTETRDEDKPVQSNDRTNSVELMFVPSESKPKKSSHMQIFRKHLSKENGTEKGKKTRKQWKKEREPSIYEDIDEMATEETKPEDATTNATEDTTKNVAEDTSKDALQMIAVEKPRKSEIKALLHALSRSKVNKHPKFCTVDKVEYSTRSITGYGDGDSYISRRTFREENEGNIEDSEDENEEIGKLPAAHRSDEETEIRSKSKRKKFSQFRLRDKKNKDKLNGDMRLCTHKNRTRFRVVKMLMPHFIFKGSGKKGLDEYMNNKDEAWDKTVDLGSGDAASYSEEAGKLFGKKHRRVLLVRKKSLSHEATDDEEGNKRESSDPVSTLMKLVRSDQKNGHNMLQDRHEDDIKNYFYSRGRRSTILEHNNSMVPVPFYKNIKNEERLDNKERKLIKKFENNETPFRNSIHTETISGSGRSTEEEINLVKNKRDTLEEHSVDALKFQRERLSTNSLMQTDFSTPLLIFHDHYKGTSIDCRQKNFHPSHLHDFVTEAKTTKIQSSETSEVKKNLQSLNHSKILNNHELSKYRLMMTIPITQRTELQIPAFIKTVSHAEANKETSSGTQNDSQLIVLSRRLRGGMRGNTTRELTPSQIPLTCNTWQNMVTVHWNLKRQVPLKKSHTKLINLDTVISRAPVNHPDVRSCELDAFYPKVSILKIVQRPKFQHPQGNQLPPKSIPPSVPQIRSYVQDFKTTQGLLDHKLARGGEISKRGQNVEESKSPGENTIYSKEADDGMKSDNFFDPSVNKKTLIETMTENMLAEHSSLNERALMGNLTVTTDREPAPIQITALHREDTAKINCGKIMMTTECPLLGYHIQNSSTNIFLHNIVPKQVEENQIISLKVITKEKKEKNDSPNNIRTFTETPANTLTNGALLADSSEVPTNIAVVSNPSNQKPQSETPCSTVRTLKTVNDLSIDHLEKHSFANINMKHLQNSKLMIVNVSRTSTNNSRNESKSNFKHVPLKEKANQDTDLPSISCLGPKNHLAENVKNMSTVIEKRQGANPITGSDNKSDTNQTHRAQPTSLVINKSSKLYDNRMLQEKSSCKMTVHKKERNKKGPLSCGIFPMTSENPLMRKKQFTKISHDLAKFKEEGGKEPTVLRRDDILPLGDNEINDIASIVETLEPVPQPHPEGFAVCQSQHVPCTRADSSEVKLCGRVKLQQKGYDKVSDLTSVSATEFPPPYFNPVKVTRNHVILRPVQFINDNPKNKYPFLPVLQALNASKTQEFTTVNSVTKSSTRWYQGAPETRLTNITTYSSFPDTTLPYTLDFTQTAKNISMSTSQGFLSEHIDQNLPTFDQMKHPGASAYRLKLKNLSVQELKDANCEILTANLSEGAQQNSLKRRERSQSDFETNFAWNNSSNSIIESGYDLSSSRLGRDFSDKNSSLSMYLGDLPTITYSNVTAGYFNDLHTADRLKGMLEPNLALFPFQNRNEHKITLEGCNSETDSLRPNLEMNIFQSIGQDDGAKDAVPIRNEDACPVKEIPNLLETSSIKRQKSFWNGEKTFGENIGVTTMKKAMEGMVHLADGDVFVMKNYKNQGGDTNWKHTTVRTRVTHDKSNKQFSSTADKHDYIHTGDGDKKFGREDINIDENKIDKIGIDEKIVFPMDRAQKDEVRSGSLHSLSKFNNLILNDLHTTTTPSSKKITGHHQNDEGFTKNNILVIRYYNRMPKLERKTNILSNEENQAMKTRDKSSENLAILNSSTDEEQTEYAKLTSQEDETKPEQYRSKKFRDEKEAQDHFEKILGSLSSTSEEGSHGKVDSQFLREEIDRGSRMSLNKRRKLLIPRMKSITISNFKQLEWNERPYQLQGNHFLGQGRADVQETENPSTIQKPSLLQTFINLGEETPHGVPFIYNHSSEATDKPNTSPYAEWLNGVQAMRIVDSVLSKVHQSKDLPNEFGLCKTDFNKIREEIFPPPIESNEKGGIDMGFMVAEQNNLDKQSSPTCIMLTPEMRKFLEWLLYDKPSEQSKALVDVGVNEREM